MFVSCRLVHKNHRWGSQEQLDFDNPVQTCKAFQLDKKRQLKVEGARIYKLNHFLVSKQKIAVFEEAFCSR